MISEALRIDHLLINLVQNYRISQLDILFQIISFSVFIAYFLGISYLVKNKELKRGTVFFVAIGAVVIIVMAMKIAIGRWRPDMSEALSFPSLHATLAFFFIVYFWTTLKKYNIPLVIWAGLVAFSRMWLDLHYFSDIVAGAAFGIIIADYLKIRVLNYRLRSLINNKQKLPSFRNYFSEKSQQAAGTPSQKNNKIRKKKK